MTIGSQAPRGNWSYPTQVRFGAGRIGELADACKSVGIHRPLLITDPVLAESPMVQRAIAANSAAGLPTGVFSNIVGNPTGKNVEDGVAAYRAGGHDGVIAFGGGSALDVGKTVALMAGQSRQIWDFEDVGDNWKLAEPAGIAPVIAVATTAGTGSEVGRASVITDETTHTKKIIFHPNMMPKIAIADAELSIGLPPHITAATGMDALAHCLEAYCAPFYHPMADGIAVEGIRLVKENLPIAVRNGGDVVARSNMLVAASMGAAAFQKGLGLVHALSHPVGSLYGAHHGLCNGIVMPYVLAYNRSAIETKLTRLAAWLSLPDPGYTAVLDWVLALRRDIAIPHTLREVGVERDKVDELAEMAVVDPSGFGNPVPYGVPELRQLYFECIDGVIS